MTVLQRSSRILPDEASDVTETLTGLLRAEGIDIKTGVTVQAVEKQNSKVTVHVRIGNAERTIQGTHLFVATGRSGNGAGIGLEAQGVELYGNGFVRTDAYLQTTAPDIYAAGDITGQHLFVYSAAYEGALAVDNMFGEQPTAKDYTVFPWVIFTDPQVAGVGLDEKQANEKKIDYDVSVVHMNDVPRALAAHNTRGFIKLLRNKANDQLIGARMVASEGSEMLMEIALAIRYRIPVKELKQMFHPYLTLSEAVKIALIAFDKDVKKLSCCAV